jgi:hypothetical protein
VSLRLEVLTSVTRTSTTSGIPLLVLPSMADRYHLQLAIPVPYITSYTNGLLFTRDITIFWDDSVINHEDGSSKFSQNDGMC